VGVGFRCSRWSFQDFDVVGVEDSVETGSIFGIAVADEESQGFHSGVEIAEEILAFVG
jgi:hypothetical protein